MVEKAIFEILSNDNTLVGLNVKTFFGVYPEILLQKNYIVFNRMGTEPYDTKTGYAVGNITLKSGKSTLDKVNININMFASDTEALVTMSKAVRNALDRTSGVFNGIKVQSIQYDGESNSFDFNDSYNKKGIYQDNQIYSCRVEI